MTDEVIVEEKDLAPDELTLLKKRADQMGVGYHPKIGIESLKTKIDEKLSGEKPVAEADTSKMTPAMIKSATRIRVRKEALKLIRVRVSNLNPKKNDVPGEIFTVANKYIGEVKKYIPYGEVTENGYHVEKCLYDNLKSRKYLKLRTIKSKTLGKPDTVKQSWVPEFSIDILDPLTAEELKELGRMQEARDYNDDE